MSWLKNATAKGRTDALMTADAIKICFYVAENEPSKVFVSTELPSEISEMVGGGGGAAGEDAEGVVETLHHLACGPRGSSPRPISDWLRLGQRK